MMAALFPVRLALVAGLIGATVQSVGALAAQTASVRDGAGDEATLAAHRSDLLTRLAGAERVGAMSRAAAARHRRALDTMLASARRDIARPPHFISAAENATYRRTIAGVEAALARSGSAGDDATPWGLIVAYTPGDQEVRRHLLALTRSSGLTLGYDMPRMNRITVNGEGGQRLANMREAFRRTPGVLSVDLDGASQTQAATP